MKAAEVIAFWFETCTPAQWFQKDAEFDDNLRAQFAGAVGEALSGVLAGWEASAQGRLALVILLDQFCRNLYRGTPQAFAGDERALRVCQAAVAAGDLAVLGQQQRQFLLMPMMHSEDIAVQDASLPLFAEHTDERTHRYAVQHRDIVARFGRYPHRNVILGRESTPEERVFLTEPGSSF